jgi:CBS domain containing-hemolysin-like protein
MAVLFWIYICTLIATAVSSLGRRALGDFSHHDLEEICRKQKNNSRNGEILRQHEQVALGVEIVFMFCLALQMTSGLWWAQLRWGPTAENSDFFLLGCTAGLSLLLLISGVSLPWVFARLSAALFLFHTWPLWKTLALAMFPFVWITLTIDTAIHRIAGRTPPEVDEESLEEEIRAIVTEGHREGLLEEDAREMIEGVIDLDDAVVSEIMTPRTDMHMILVSTPWDEVVADVIQTGHTRTPVYENSRDDVIGILYSKDLLPELATGSPQSRTPIKDLLRKPVFVPETKALDDLLQMFQQLRTHIAVVLDEYGGVAGLVTIEDVLEEIVGEIVDEYDPEVTAEINRINENTYEALGRTHVDVINRAMHLELPDDGDFDTIGGFVFTDLGRIPLPGETVLWQDKVRIHVLDASKRRINRVRIERIDDAERDIA